MKHNKTLQSNRADEEIHVCIHWGEMKKAKEIPTKRIKKRNEEIEELTYTQVTRIRSCRDMGTRPGLAKEISFEEEECDNHIRVLHLCWQLLEEPGLQPPLHPLG